MRCHLDAGFPHQGQHGDRLAGTALAHHRLPTAAELAKEGYRHAAQAERAAAEAHRTVADSIDARADRSPQEADRLRAEAQQHRRQAEEHLRGAAFDEARLAELESE